MTPTEPPAFPPSDPKGKRPFVWRLLKVEPGEGASLLTACVYFFCLLSAYYLVRPVRDAPLPGESRASWIWKSRV